jgi:hypothetical protein
VIIGATFETLGQRSYKQELVHASLKARNSQAKIYKK